MHGMCLDTELEVQRTIKTAEIWVGHAKTHLSKKEKQQLSLFEQFVTEGNERADEFAKDGAMVDGGEMNQIMTSTFQQKGGVLRGSAARR